MSHVIFGRPAFQCPNGSPFGLVELLQTSFFIEMALLQEIEDDGLKRLCGHGSTLSYFATTYALVKVSHEKRPNLARISGSWMRRHLRHFPLWLQARERMFFTNSAWEPAWFTHPGSDADREHPNVFGDVPPN
jgi:hypothetical protein